MTPVEDATLYIDYDGDGTNEVQVDVDELTTYKAKATDKDMSGAYIFATKPGAQPDGEPVNIAVVWGQDPEFAESGEPNQFDLGTWQKGVAILQVLKTCVLRDDLDGCDTAADATPGDRFDCTIKVR